jgi:hypothetical protein
VENVNCVRIYGPTFRAVANAEIIIATQPKNVHKIIANHRLSFPITKPGQRGRNEGNQFVAVSFLRINRLFVENRKRVQGVVSK